MQTICKWSTTKPQLATERHTLKRKFEHKQTNAEASDQAIG